jgi:hypothetical protein
LKGAQRVMSVGPAADGGGKARKDQAKDACVAFESPLNQGHSLTTSNPSPR